MATIRPSVVIIGGGGGPYLVGTGLRNNDVDLTIISTPADNGGSSGRIRGEFGQVLPPGDLRRGLMALMESEEDRAFFDERFDDSLFTDGKKQLGDHSLGNILILGAQKRNKSIIGGLEYLSRKFDVRGKVYPMSADHTHLHASLSDGKELKSETEIDTRSIADESTIVRAWLQPQAFICRQAADAIRAADFIIIGPGDPYSSLIANLLVNGARQALAESNARIICVANLMDKPAESRGFSVADFLDLLLQYDIGRPKFDACVVNSTRIPRKLLSKYRAEEKSNPILIKKNEMARLHELVNVIHTTDILSEEASRRGYIRHDSQKLAHALMEVMRMHDRVGSITHAGDTLLARKLQKQEELMPNVSPRGKG